MLAVSDRITQTAGLFTGHIPSQQPRKVPSGYSEEQRDEESAFVVGTANWDVHGTKAVPSPLNQK
jgi:hypothetical protein